MNLGHHAQAGRRVGVIENQRILFARSRAQAAPDYLHEQHLGLGRTSQLQASYVPINTGRQSPNVCDYLVGPVMETALDIGAISARRVSVLVGAGDARIGEALLEHLRVGTVDRKE